MTDCDHSPLKRRKRIVENDSNNADSTYVAFTTVEYPLKDAFDETDDELWWCCSCTNLPQPNDGLELCKDCNTTLFHKTCGAEFGGQCPRCKYDEEWPSLRIRERSCRWCKEDNIRLIVLCDQGYSKNTIRSKMNVTMHLLKHKIKTLISEKRLIYERKKIKPDWKQDSDSDSDYENARDDSDGSDEEFTDRQSKRKRWTPKEDERLLKLYRAGTDDINSSIMEKMEKIVPRFMRTAVALHTRLFVLQRERNLNNVKKKVHNRLTNEVKQSQKKRLKRKRNKSLETKKGLMQKPTKQRKVDNDALNVPKCVIEIWLKYDVGLPQYASNFIDEGYDDMDVIIHTMTDDDLLAIGIKLRGHRAKIMHHIGLIKKERPD